MFNDLKFAFRQLLKNPGFTAVAVLTLALGIGANSAVFGVVKSVLLDALPYADADRLVRLYGSYRDRPQERGPLSAGTIRDITDRQRSFEKLSAFQDFASEAVYGGNDRPQTVKTAWVEPGFFQTLGVSAASGRTFSQDDTTSGLAPLSGGQLSPDTARVVVVSHAAWQRLFAGDPSAVGRDVPINGILRKIIGVLPSDFVAPMGQADIYFAFDLGPVRAHPIAGRRSSWLGFIARLKPGVTHETAQRELAAIGAELAREYPESNGNLELATMPLRDAMLGDTRTPLLVLMASAGLVLFIACANLAGALLTRTLARRKEFAVRAALGAGSGRLIRQLLTESAVLALAGGVTGLLLAALLLAFLRGLALPALPAYADLSLDAGAGLVTAMLALGTGFAFGLAPALSIGRADPQATLRGESRSATESRHSRHLRGALASGQMALCISLLAGAGLLARSLWSMTSAPLGFEPNGVLTVFIQLPPRDYPTPEARARFYEQFLERLRTLPGVEAVANGTSIPTAVRSRMPFTIDGAPWPGTEAPLVLFASVSDDYFRTLGIPIRKGRTFDAQDHAGTPAVVVISESMARRYWPGGEALGARIRIGPTLMEVVGIVGDVRNDPARRDAEPMAYSLTRQNPWPIASFLLRAPGEPMALVRSVERELAAMDAGLPLDLPMTLNEVVGEKLASRRLPVFLMGAFGALALLLASVGVYAMFASMAAEREREFGVRLALGSRPRAIAGLVLWQGALWMAAGLAGGALGIVMVVRFVRELLYGVGPFDPLALGVAVTTVMTVAIMAALLPAVRASRIDPARALRAE